MGAHTLARTQTHAHTHTHTHTEHLLLVQATQSNVVGLAAQVNETK